MEDRGGNVLDAGSQEAPHRERISFQPHPKTLTMAGDYEYFAAQGHHPFVYAVAEFVDNAIQATKAAARKREITVTLVLPGREDSGAVSVSDNGCGMTGSELNKWAVANLSMEEKGLAPREALLPARSFHASQAVPSQLPGDATGAAGRFLSSEISHFGVGSKNAAFFIGRRVRMTTREPGSKLVHELTLAADALEERYAAGAAVYEEDMVHRCAGDEAALVAGDARSPALKRWVSEERDVPTDRGFTRVVIADLKQGARRQLSGDLAGREFCKELAHLYHYYLHGEHGAANEGGSDQLKTGRLPDGTLIPNVVIDCWRDGERIWSTKLSEVQSDLESVTLNTGVSPFEFVLEIPDKARGVTESQSAGSVEAQSRNIAAQGTVHGTLRYFPFSGQQETFPRKERASLGDATGTPSSTQPSQRQSGGDSSAASVVDLTVSDDEQEEPSQWRHPVFSMFWQGRLIPGSTLETLPFIEEVRSRRTAAAKDACPDEVFRRFRGSLFCGPGFCVTRNKLLFRDSLPECFGKGIPLERHLAKRFREWLVTCHAQLDRSFRFESLAPATMQATVRGALGEHVTAFLRVTDGGARTIGSSDYVRLLSKPAQLARVLYCTVPMIVTSPGLYSCGRVRVELLPKEVHGEAAKDVSLRRVDRVLTAEEALEAERKELAKLPSSLALEPAKFVASERVEMKAGSLVPPSSLSICAEGGQHLTRAILGGEKTPLMIVQRLWLLADRAGVVPGAHSEPAAPVPKKKGGKRQRRSSVRAEVAEPSENGHPIVGALETPTDRTLVVSVENRTPVKDEYHFARISGGLKTAGKYELEYVVSPRVPGRQELKLTVPIEVVAAEPVALVVDSQAPGITTLETLRLGEAFPAVPIKAVDQFENPAELCTLGSPPSAMALEWSVEVQRDREWASCDELAVECRPGTRGALQIVGRSALPASPLRCNAKGKPAGLALFSEAESVPVRLVAHSPALPDLSRVSIPVSLRAGIPVGIWVDQLSLCGREESESQSQSPSSIRVRAGDTLVPIPVELLDAWGNAASTNDVQTTIKLRSELLDPEVTEFEATSSALTIEGVRVALHPRVWKGPLTLSILPDKASEALVEPTPGAIAPIAREAILDLDVEPSGLPATIGLALDGKALEPREDVAGDLAARSFAFPAFVAGTGVKNVVLSLLDETLEPCSRSLSCKVFVSWRTGSKRVTWTGQGIKLPTIKLSTTSGASFSGWVRVECAGCPVTIQCSMSIDVVPGPPISWSISLLDDEEEVGDRTEKDASVAVRCGVPFSLGVEALDTHGNRCSGELLPGPKITVESESPVSYDPDEWERGWNRSNPQLLSPYVVRMELRGPPCEVLVRASTPEDAEEVPSIAEGSVRLALCSGPPVRLAFEGLSRVVTGMTATIPALRVRLADIAGTILEAPELGGNKDTWNSVDVSLESSALSTAGDGLAAAVAAAPNNRARLRGGTATFKSVHVHSSAGGEFALRAIVTSRKVSLEDAVLTLCLRARNVVTALRVTLPDELLGGCKAGSSASADVEVVTEDGKPLDRATAERGLTLHLSRPGAANDGNDAALLPGKDPNRFTFALGELCEAGTYDVSAEYVETRSDMLKGLDSRAARVRSSTMQFAVLPSDPVAVRLDLDKVPDYIAVTNVEDPEARTILEEAVVLTIDEHGNVVPTAGVEVRCQLRRPPDSSSSQGVVPELRARDGDHASNLAGQTDKDGKCHLGTLILVEGSGSAPQKGLPLELVIEGRGLEATPGKHSDVDDRGWCAYQSISVLFSDDAARFKLMAEAKERRDELCAKRDELRDDHDSAKEDLALIKRQRETVEQHIRALERDSATPLPKTLAEATRARDDAEREAQEQPEDAAADDNVLAARYGPVGASMTNAISMVLSSGDAGVVGVVAQLATIDDESLSRIASAVLRSVLGVVVVDTAETRDRITKELRSKNMQVPDFLPMTHSVSFREPKRSRVAHRPPSIERARQLELTACQGSDPPLPVPLPHTALARSEKEGAEWPQGCLGYLYNLMRPTMPSLRQTLLYNLIGSTLVFETLADASKYREHVVRDLHGRLGDLIALDGSRISGRGITSGSSFHVPPLAEMHLRFGASAISGQASRRELASARAKDISSLIEHLKELDELAREATRLESTLEDYDRRMETELPSIEAEIDKLETTLLEAAETSPLRAARAKRPSEEKRVGDRKKRRSAR